ncbi:Crp/Fnr family transcriptional regulator [Fibrobacterota bacterium]
MAKSTRLRNLLKKVDLFAPLKNKQLEILSKMASIKSYKRNETILSENDHSRQSFFIIAKGQVKVYISGIDGKEAILALLGEGGFFGEMSLLDGEPRSASVKAVKSSQLVLIRREDFLAEIKKHQELSMILLVEMSQRIRRADKQISSLALMSVYGRIAGTLLQIMKEQGKTIRLIDDSVVTVIRKRPSQQQLADMSGTTRETVSRALHHLQKKGFIALSGKDIYIFQESALRG